MINPWAIIGGIILVIAMTGTAYFKGHAVGVQSERNEWLVRESAQVIAANKKVIEMTAAAREKEAKFALDLAAVASAYEGKLKNANEQKRKDVAAVGAGTLGLHFRATCPGPDRGEARGPASGPGVDHGPGAGELPGAVDPPVREITLPQTIVAGLFEIVDDADRVVEKLTACQDVVKADRK